MKKVLIFGINGFVGRYLSNEFLAHGYSVIGSDKARNKPLFKGINLYEANLLDYKKVEYIINQCSPDIIINLAAISSVGISWSMPQTTMSVNVIGPLNILEAARKLIIKPKILLIGSSEEYVISNFPMNEDRKLNASNPYGISKITQERFAELYREQYGMKVYCVRAFNHTGVGQKDTFVLPSFCRQIALINKSGTPGTIKVGNLTVKRDFSHVKDVVRAYRMILESDNCNIIYNVGSGKAYSLKTMLDFIISLSVQKITVEIDQSRFRPTDQPVICCDHNLITSQLGWEPQLTVFDALREMYKIEMEK